MLQDIANCRDRLCMLKLFMSILHARSHGEAPKPRNHFVHLAYSALTLSHFVCLTNKKMCGNVHHKIESMALDSERLDGTSRTIRSQPKITHSWFRRLTHSSSQPLQRPSRDFRSQPVITQSSFRHLTHSLSPQPLQRPFFTWLFVQTGRSHRRPISLSWMFTTVTEKHCQKSVVTTYS